MGSGFQKLRHLLGFVRRQIIHDDMNLLLRTALFNYLAEGVDKLLTCMPRRRLAVHLARLHVERCVQRERAMPVVFKSMPFHAAGRQGQHRIQTVQSLDCRLLVHTENGSVLRRIQIQPNDVCGFGLEVRIVAGQKTVAGSS